MLITGVEEQKRHENRVSVFIDGVFSFGVSKELAHIYNISEGRQLSGDEYRDIAEGIFYDDAVGCAVKYLSYAPRTVSEVIAKLNSRDFPDGIIKKVILFLKGQGYVNDALYAENYVCDKLKNGYGAYRIKRELRLKGVGSGYIEQAFDIAGVDSISVITELVKKRIKSDTSKDFYKNEWRKIQNYLLARGFGHGDIKNALYRYWNEARDENDADI